MKSIKKRYLSIIIFAIFLNLFFSFNCFAQPLTKEAADRINAQADEFMKSAGYSNADEKSISQIVATIIRVFLGLLGIIFVVLLIYGGYLWMTARGDEQQVTKAKDNLRMAVIGLIIILAAYSITYFVFKSLPFEGGTGGGGGGAAGVGDM